MEINIGGQTVKVDLDRLTPTARALAEAIADTDSRSAVDIWVEADEPISATVPNWHLFYTVAEAARGERRPWRGWSDVPLGPAEDPHARLEHEAEKIPVGWHVYGAHPSRPLPGAGPIREATSGQVLAYLNANGRAITPATWRSYVARKQAPAPVRTVGRTPLWDMAEIEEWHKPRVGRCAHLGCTRDYTIIVGGMAFCSVDHVPDDMRGLVAQ